MGGVAPASAATGVSVVTAGLDSPRGVALSHGDVLVAEAGHGGDICIPNAIFGTNCIGLNSQISVVEAGSGEHHPLISHLFSSLLRSAETLVVSGIATRGDSVLAILANTHSSLRRSTARACQPIVLKSKPRRSHRPGS